MERKTFDTRPEAVNYQAEITATGCLTKVEELGEKYRVYFYPAGHVAERQKYFEGYTELNARQDLRNEAYRAYEAVSEALDLQEMIENHKVYDEYEYAYEAAKLLVKNGDLETAKDVIDFIGDPSKYDTEMQAFIDNTLYEYDYDYTYEKEQEAKGETQVETLWTDRAIP